MPTEDAYSSGHLVLSHFGTCMCSNVETNLSWTCLVSGPLNFEHPSVLLFCLMTMNSINFAIKSKQVLILLTLLSCICLFYCELTAANINKAGYLEIKQTQCWTGRISQDLPFMLIVIFPTFENWKKKSHIFLIFKRQYYIQNIFFFLMTAT